MAHMFLGAAAFNQPTGEWNTDVVTSVAGTFSGASAINQPIGGCNIGCIYIQPADWRVKQ